MADTGRQCWPTFCQEFPFQLSFFFLWKVQAFHWLAGYGATDIKISVRRWQLLWQSVQVNVDFTEESDTGYLCWRHLADMTSINTSHIQIHTRLQYFHNRVNNFHWFICEAAYSSCHIATKLCHKSSENERRNVTFYILTAKILLSVFEHSPLTISLSCLVLFVSLIRCLLPWLPLGGLDVFSVWPSPSSKFKCCETLLEISTAINVFSWWN